MVKVMFFLLRIAFWLGLVCVLLPGGAKTTSPEAKIDATQAMTLASAAVSDMRGFCDRRPDACAVGGKVAVALGHKAEAGARTIYDFIIARLSKKSTPAETTAQRTILPRMVLATGRNQETLSRADMAPVWHTPVPLPPRREARASRPSA
jgi:Family of unknown function (DUF5330)